MILLGAGVLVLLFASFFVHRSGRTLDALEADTVEEASAEEVLAATEAASDWGAGATLMLCGLGLIVLAFVFAV